jgi:hypothetical protein
MRASSILQRNNCNRLFLNRKIVIIETTGIMIINKLTGNVFIVISDTPEIPTSVKLITEPDSSEKLINPLFRNKTDISVVRKR